jgi:hypothetical protein
MRLLSALFARRWDLRANVLFTIAASVVLACAMQAGRAAPFMIVGNDE